MKKGPAWCRAGILIKKSLASDGYDGFFQVVIVICQKTSLICIEHSPLLAVPIHRGPLSHNLQSFSQQLFPSACLCGTDNDISHGIRGYPGFGRNRYTLRIRLQERRCRPHNGECRNQTTSPARCRL